MNNNILFYVLIFVPFTILIFLDTKELFGEKEKKENNKVLENKEVEEKIEENKE
jgi:hypothetical protein